MVHHVPAGQGTLGGQRIVRVIAVRLSRFPKAAYSFAWPDRGIIRWAVYRHRRDGQDQITYLPEFQNHTSITMCLIAWQAGGKRLNIQADRGWWNLVLIESKRKAYR